MPKGDANKIATEGSLTMKKRKADTLLGYQPLEARAVSFVFILILFILWPFADADAVRLKDVAAVKGVRANQLIGYGLVVGLNGTGDGNQAAFTGQGLINMMKNMGVHVPKTGIKVKNVASVMITAQLPPFVKVGQAIDVTLSSLGDASSLQGGTLVSTPLTGLDGKVYAIAQGPISIGGFEVAGEATGVQKNHQTVARIPDGASVEREVPVSFADKDTITFSLNEPDFTSVSRMVTAINDHLGGPFAKARDGASVDISVPGKYRENSIALLAALEKLEITPDRTAKVVLDERTGTVVMGENVRISQVAISRGNLSLQVMVPAASPTTDELIQEMSRSNVPLRKQENRLVRLPAGASLGEVVRALNSVGVTPRDLIAIFQSIKAAGALQADLEII